MHLRIFHELRRMHRLRIVAKAHGGAAPWQGDTPLETRSIAYECEGTTLTGYFADNAPNTKKPAILVAHEAFGINDHIRARTRRLAELGYAAFALDMYGVEGIPLSEAVRRHIELMSTPGRMLTRASAALRLLMALPGVDQNRMAAIGFCQGGITALELARSGAPIQCAVGFHPGVLSRNRRKFRQPINVACPAPGRWGRPNSRVTSRHFDHGNASRTSRPDCSGLDEAD